MRLLRQPFLIKSKRPIQRRTVTLIITVVLFDCVGKDKAVVAEIPYGKLPIPHTAANDGQEKTRRALCCAGFNDFWFGASRGFRTPDPRRVKAMLYP